MGLEVSAWTRRDRLERIADAERDRRAGRVDLALAAVGVAEEWPARLVSALSRLPDEAGDEARAILESTLDDWAAETGLGALDPVAAADEADRADIDEAAPAIDAPTEYDEVLEAEPVYRAEPVEAEQVEVEADLVADAVEPLAEDLLSPLAEDLLSPIAPRSTDVLGAPIAVDELERAFAEAEAQTDEMHDVNDVAERVLMDEPVGLAELSGEGLDRVEAEPAEDDGIQTDAAWAEAPIWPEPVPSEAPRSAALVPVDDGSVGAPAEDDFDAAVDAPARAQILDTLERWLDNIRAGRAQ